MQHGNTLFSLLKSQGQGDRSSKKKSKKSRRRRRTSSTSSSSSEEDTNNQKVNDKPVVPAAASYMNVDPSLYYYMQQNHAAMGMVVPVAQPPPPNIQMTVPPLFAAPPPVPPVPPPPAQPPGLRADMMPNMCVPPPPLPQPLMSIPIPPPAPPLVSQPPLPPAPPLPSPKLIKEVAVASASSTSTTAVGKLPLPRRRFDQPVVLNKERRDIDLCSEWGSGYVEKYELNVQVGEGTYGQVYKATERVTGDQVALKRVRLENEKEGFPITAVREIKILRQLNHHNVVKLLDIVTDRQSASDLRNDKVNFYLVFEYVDHDLTGLLEAAANNLIPAFTTDQIASMFKQLLQGLEYCHKAKFLHRDIKCSNILVNNKGELKIADFGLARLYYEDQERLYTNRVITLWYRPPELLLGEEHYGPPVDVWSAGCILAEFFTKKALFTGQNEMMQLDQISRICGTPTPEVWPDVERLQLYHTFRPKRIFMRSLQTEFSMLMPNAALDLLDKILVLDPKKRITATDALKHLFVKNIDTSRVAPPRLPQNQDCHELWSKKQRKERRSGVPPPQLELPAQPQQAEPPVQPPRLLNSSAVPRNGDSRAPHKSAITDALHRIMRGDPNDTQLGGVIDQLTDVEAQQVLDGLQKAKVPVPPGASAKERICALMTPNRGGRTYPPPINMQPSSHQGVGYPHYHAYR